MAKSIITSDDHRLQVANDLSAFRYDPYGHTLYTFPWGEPDIPLEDKKIKEWQQLILSIITLHLADPSTRYDPLRIAVASGHGIGKSALFGMISNWAMSTHPDSRCLITANTEGQLRTKTSPEIAKWFRMSMTADWFDINTLSISMKGDKASSWTMDFTPWSLTNTEAFQGLHNMGKLLLIMYDEGSAIDDKIWEVTEGALTDEDTIIIWIVFGNPTRNTGRFRECFRKYSKYWKSFHIDSSTVEGTNKKLFAQWKEQYGIDSDFYRVRVRGQFPNQSAKQLFPTDIVEAAQRKELTKDMYSFAPVILTCDPAWTGDDDLTISVRQGLYFEVLKTIPKNNNDLQIARILATLQDEWSADAVFIDGGYGTGIYSAGQAMNRDWMLVWFAEKSIRLDCVNKRAEMYINALEWLKEGGSIDPNDNELYEELIGIEVVGTMDGKYKIPSKEDIKEIIGRSPNRLDSLVLSFAYPVTPAPKPGDLTGIYDQFTAANRLPKRDRDFYPLERFESES